MKNLYLFFGEEKFLIEQQVEKIKRKIVEEHLEQVNYIVLDGKNVSSDEIINAVVTVPMMQDEKLVVVRDAVIFESGKSRAVGNYDMEKLLDCIENMPKYTYLVFTCLKADRRKKIFKLVQKKGVVHEFSAPSLNAKAKWIVERASLYKKKIDMSCARILAQYTQDLFQTDSELKKLVSYVKDNTQIQKDDLEAIFSKSLENTIFEMMDYIGEKMPSKAIGVFNNLLDQGEKSILILFMISKHITNLILVKSMQDMEFNEIKERTGLHPFVLRKALHQSKKFSQNELKEAAKLCQQLDIDLKRGRIDEKSGIEFLITKISI
ncbi:MAG TPA: DNA polymerase III subunit delta [Thermoanaerobacterales bacterium]|nr:DNA polymerase III subunit delta [Thermoanaerobacterales bacterium]